MGVLCSPQTETESCDYACTRRRRGRDAKQTKKRKRALRGISNIPNHNLMPGNVLMSQS